MVINKDVIFDEQLMLKQSLEADALTFEKETSSKHVIQMDVNSPPANNLQVVP